MNHQILGIKRSGCNIYSGSDSVFIGHDRFHRIVEPTNAKIPIWQSLKHLILFLSGRPDRFRNGLEIQICMDSVKTVLLLSVVPLYIHDEPILMVCLQTNHLDNCLKKAINPHFNQGKEEQGFIWNSMLYLKVLHF
jgi:hypothetical protein